MRLLYDRVWITPEVRAEVVERGRAAGKSEVGAIESLAASGFLEVREAPRRPPAGARLAAGELSTLGLAQSEGVRDVLIDERAGVGIARALELNPIRTTRVLVLLRRRRALTREQYQDHLRALSRLRYFMTAEVFEELLREP